MPGGEVKIVIFFYMIKSKLVRSAYVSKKKKNVLYLISFLSKAKKQQQKSSINFAGLIRVSEERDVRWRKTVKNSCLLFYWNLSKIFKRKTTSDTGYYDARPWFMSLAC